MAAERTHSPRLRSSDARMRSSAKASARPHTGKSTARPPLITFDCEKGAAATMPSASQPSRIHPRGWSTWKSSPPSASRKSAPSKGPTSAGTGATSGCVMTMLNAAIALIAPCAKPSSPADQPAAAPAAVQLPRQRPGAAATNSAASHSQKPRQPMPPAAGASSCLRISARLSQANAPAPASTSPLGRRSSASPPNSPAVAAMGKLPVRVARSSAHSPSVPQRTGARKVGSRARCIKGSRIAVASAASSAGRRPSSSTPGTGARRKSSHPSSHVAATSARAVALPAHNSPVKGLRAVAIASAVTSVASHC